MITEDRIIPYVSSPPVGRRVLVLAPHPDDESIGCGGALSLLVQSGAAVKVVFLTKGEKADPHCRDRVAYEALREKEALKALQVLKIADYTFLRFPDRGLFEQCREAESKLMSIVDAFAPDAIYSPSPIDLNPDHRATAAVALQLRRQCGCPVVFYELTTPIRPNLLVDISKVFRVKKKAVKAYRSQLRLIDYLRYIAALNVYRSFTLGGRCSEAEAYYVCGPDDSEHDIAGWLGFEDVCLKNSTVLLENNTP